jgi:holo-[acyl-carrier protein] synthase
VTSPPAPAEPGQPLRTGWAMVVHGGHRSPAELLAPSPLGEVFTPAEMRLCGSVRGLTRWAGRLAAKRAVVAAAGAPPWPLRDVELLVERSACYAPHRCAQGHPPLVRLHGDAAGWWPDGVVVDVSISHTRRAAVAVALASGENGREVARGVAEHLPTGG